MDRLKEIYEIQDKFTKKFFEKKGLTLDDIKNDKELKIKWNKEYILALSKEVYEVLDEIDWKSHTTKITEDVDDNILEECVDVMKYLLGLMQLNGFSIDDIYSKFKDKSNVVEAKFTQEETMNKIKKSSKPIAFIDIDGVLADWPGGFLEFVSKELGKTFTTITQFKNDIPKKQQYQLKSNYRTSGKKAELDVLDGAKEFMQSICHEYSIVLLTARPYKKYFRIYSDTLKWLADNDICYDAIMFDEEKEKYIINNFEPEQVAFCVDDDISNANKLSDNGFKVYLRKNLGIYSEDTLSRKLNSGIEILNGNILELKYIHESN